MDKDTYTNSLENLLIYMCQTYEDQEKVLLQLAKEEGNRAFFEVPKIQGTYNVIPISQLAKMEFQQPEHGFSDVKDEILRKRNHS